ncbi:hypothetical protein FE257_012302 [Aspergillus nanangensis]|uniref:Uncharacterized protein n=1 Tax=Aspergillus nanangensis TaxID=2582783 RepID=A0AAD4CG26_ASPNN|nr:hypothetical protein FE257_012302 [Aspergillus nanangensis]
MAPKTPVNRFFSLALFAVLALLCIYKGASHSHHEVRALSKRETPEDVTIHSPNGSHPALDPGEELQKYILAARGEELHILGKRAPAETVDEAVRNGKGLWCQLVDTDVDEALHTSWTDPGDLNEWYSPHPYGNTGDLTDTGRDISTALGALGLPTNTGDRGLTGMIYHQDREFMLDGEEKDATWGYYRASLSPQMGYISAEDNESPWYASGKRYTPPLSKLSDVYYLFWKELSTNKNVKNLKYFFRHHVINTQSKRIALEVAGGAIPEWPGVSYDMSTDQGKAILGTPNGSGVAFFLINHKPELGVRVPTKVTLFKTIGRDANGQPEDWVHFLFYIAVSKKK